MFDKPTLVTSHWETSDSRIVISSEVEKSFSFAIRRTMFGNGKREACYPPKTSSIAPYILGKAATNISHFSFLISHSNEPFKTLNLEP